MRVRCIKPSFQGEIPPDGDRWLTIGREYDVLCISFSSDKHVSFRLIGNDKHTPALFGGELFDVTDQSIPKNWVICKTGEHDYTFGPRAWSEVGYWERYFDREEKAITVFHEQCNLMNS
jgi:hypothetical protein